MFATPSSLLLEQRKDIISRLDDVLRCGLALQLLLYFAHWNVKGMGFPVLHPLFGDLADKIAAYNDRIAERIVILGGEAQVEVESLNQGKALGDRALVKVVSTGVKDYLDELREARKGMEDADTDQVLMDGVLEWEKYGWQLLASIEE